jgi:hypothetical protein
MRRELLINRPRRAAAAAGVLVALVAAAPANAMHFPRDHRYPRSEVVGWGGKWGASGIPGTGHSTRGLYHLRPATLPHIPPIKY